MNVFHFVIIAYLAVNLCGCGYKADPFYSMESCIDSANLVVDCFGDSCESPSNGKVERILLLAKAKRSKNFEQGFALDS